MAPTTIRRSEPLDAVLTACGAAAFDHGALQEALVGLASITGTRAAQVVGWNPGGVRSFNFVTETNVEVEDAFIAIDGYSLENPIMRAGLLHGRLADFSTAEIYSSLDRSRDRYWNEFYAWADIPSLLCTSLSISPVGDRTALSLLRSASQGEVDPDQRLIFRRVASALAETFDVSAVLGDTIVTNVVQTVEALEAPSAALDAFGRVVGSSVAMRELLAAGDYVFLHDQRICTFGRTARETLASAWNRYAPIATKMVLRLPDRSGVVRAKGELTPLRYGGLQTSAAYLFTIANLTVEERREALFQRYGLTSAEAAVAELLAEGHAPSEIAEHRRASRETVKTQSKAVYGKLGVDGQLGLIRLLRAG